MLPPRQVGNILVITVRQPASGVVQVLGLSPDGKAERWRTELGAGPDAVRIDPAAPDAIVVVTASGATKVTMQQLRTDQVLTEPLGGKAAATTRPRMLMVRTVRAIRSAPAQARRRQSS